MRSWELRSVFFLFSIDNIFSSFFFNYTIFYIFDNYKNINLHKGKIGGLETENFKLKNTSIKRQKMNHSIKIKLPEHVDRVGICNAVEALLIQHHFKVDRNGDILTFERLTKKYHGDKLQILGELFRGFSTGTVYVEHVSPKELICKVNYLKHMVISLMVGLVICGIFSIFTDHFLLLLLRVGLPFTVLSVYVGIKKGNSQVEALLSEAIDKIPNQAQVGTPSSGSLTL